MNDTEKIFSELDTGSFSLKAFFQKHAVGILGTVAFHMFLLIVFMLIKMQSFKQINETDLVLEFAEVPEPLKQEEPEKKLTDLEYFERLVEQQIKASNMAANTSKELEKEISTDNYVEEVKKELDDSRSDEWKKQQEEIQEILQQEDMVPINEEPEKDDEETDFTGPTNISYKFLSAPFNRKSTHMPVPVYKCRGYGVVDVKVEISRLGYVTSAKASVIEASEDPDCLAEVAERYARKSIFRGNNSAPHAQPAIITYQFIAQ